MTPVNQIIATTNQSQANTYKDQMETNYEDLLVIIKTLDKQADIIAEYTCYIASNQRLTQASWLMTVWVKLN